MLPTNWCSMHCEKCKRGENKLPPCAMRLQERVTGLRLQLDEAHKKGDWWREEYLAICRDFGLTPCKDDGTVSLGASKEED